MSEPISSITPEMFGQTWNGTSITFRDIKKSASLHPIKMAMKKQHGEVWGVDEVGQYLLERRAVRGDKAQIRAVVSAKATYADTSRSVAQRVDAYISNFEGVTPNDIQTFRQMAVLEKQMVELEDRLQLKDQTPIELKVLGELYTKLSGEFRQLQTVLGIDRGSRETQVDTAFELKRMVKGAQELLRKHSIQIICSECKKKDIAINEGYILFHFREHVTWNWTSTCPRCGATITLGKVNENAESNVAVEASESGEPRTEESSDIPFD